MIEINSQKVLAPLALLGLSAGAYVLVLFGAVPVIQEASIMLTVIAGGTSVGAAGIRAKIPAVTAGIAALGFGLSIITSGFVVTVAAALVILGGLGFLISTVHLIGTRAYNVIPA